MRGLELRSGHVGTPQVRTLRQRTCALRRFAPAELTCALRTSAPSLRERTCALLTFASRRAGRGAKVSSAHLGSPNLCIADLPFAHVTIARRLVRTFPRGRANLWSAKLRRAHLWSAQF